MGSPDVVLKTAVKTSVFKQSQTRIRKRNPFSDSSLALFENTVFYSGFEHTRENIENMTFFHVWIRLLGFGIEFLLFFLLLKDLWQSEDKQPDCSSFLVPGWPWIAIKTGQTHLRYVPASQASLFRSWSLLAVACQRVFTFVPIAPLG